jgi:hypothetical protein
MNSSDEIRRDFEAAKRGIKPPIINHIPMRPEDVADRFNDAKTPLPNISTENKD